MVPVETATANRAVDPSAAALAAWKSRDRWRFLIVTQTASGVSAAPNAAKAARIAGGTCAASREKQTARPASS